MGNSAFLPFGLELYNDKNGNTDILGKTKKIGFFILVVPSYWSVCICTHFPNLNNFGIHGPVSPSQVGMGIVSYRFSKN